jgi:hydrogenase maturation protein HypF
MRTAERTAARFRVKGLVQGVGFRPFVYRLACELGLGGWVCNDPAGVLIHAEGDAEALARFEECLRGAAPRAAAIGSLTRQPAPPAGCETFRVAPSRPGTVTGATLRVPPDRAVCEACKEDVTDRPDRRHGYPFTTCTDCGPRYSILRALPYDRAATSMDRFPLCAACRAEYEDPSCRRFHAEPIACPACGPRVVLCDERGRPLAREGDAVRAAAAHLREGRIVALKGLGGFQLLARADSSEAVARLRRRKARPGKPLAVMLPSLEAARRLARLGPAEARLLTSPENPIVLVELLPGVVPSPAQGGYPQGASHLAPEVAPRLNKVGLLLPTTPLHALLLAGLGFPVVATSGNRSEEPIAIEEAEARASLADVADAFLVHDRPILRRADDSVVGVIAGEPVAVRLARGYAPLPLPALERWANARGGQGVTLLATGAQQKVAPALWTGSQAVLGPHVGDLDGLNAQAAYRRLAAELPALYGCAVGGLVCDQHSDYFTTAWALASGLSVAQVQHHHAHAAACMVEHDLLDREVLAVTWDGTGYGPDGTIWGGEVMRASATGYERLASLRPFPLPGNEAAVRQPNRVALGILAEALGHEAVLADADLLGRLGLSGPTARTLLRMAARGVNTPWTSSTGRLFDAAAALLLAAREVSYEGEAAVWLESVADPDETGAYPLPLDPGDAGVPRGDWRPLFRALLADVRRRVAVPVCAARFHNALARWAGEVVASHPGPDVVLSGGCFLNGPLTVRTQEAIERLGRRVYRHSRIPPNDGGLAVGQLAIGLALRLPLTAK